MQNLAANFLPLQVQHCGFGGMKFLQLYCWLSIFPALWSVNKKMLTIRRGYGIIYPEGTVTSYFVAWFGNGEVVPG